MVAAIDSAGPGVAKMTDIAGPSFSSATPGPVDADPGPQDPA